MFMFCDGMGMVSYFSQDPIKSRLCFFIMAQCRGFCFSICIFIYSLNLTIDPNIVFFLYFFIYC